LAQGTRKADMPKKNLSPHFIGALAAITASVLACKPRSYVAELKSSRVSADSARVANLLLQKYDGFASQNSMPAHTKWDFSAQVSRISSALSDGESVQILSQTHKATVLTQAKVSELHAAIVANIPALRNVPEPQVTVIKDAAPNAFTRAGVFCIPLPVVSREARAMDSNSRDWITVFNGKMFAADAGMAVIGTGASAAQEGCPAGLEARPDLIPALVQSLQKKSPECQVELKNAALLIAPQCYDSVAYSGGVQGVLHLAAAASLVVNTGLLAKLDEQHVEAMLAHELAHYYRNHASKNLVPGEELSYFYSVHRYTNRSAQPVQDSSPEMTALLQDLRKTASFVPYGVSGMQNHPEGTRLAQFLCQNMEKSWERAGKVRPADWVVACALLEKKFLPLRALPYSMNRNLRTLSRSQYLALDAAATSVFSVFSRMSIGEMLSLLGSDSPTQERARDGIRMAFSWLNPATGGHVPKVQNGDRISVLAATFNERAHKRDAKVLSVVSRARELGFGWYNTEVEADEIAAYILAMAGKSPRQLADSFFRFAAVLDEDSVFSPPIEECRKGFLNNWTHWTFQGKSWVPFFGSPNELHPSHCFRVYNVDMEIAGQKLPSGNPTNSSQEWLLMKGAL
jgi:Zn-dependent protease with chaperone function